MAESYEKAGVNLEAGYEVVKRIEKHVASPLTFTRIYGSYATKFHVIIFINILFEIDLKSLSFPFYIKNYVV